MVRRLAIYWVMLLVGATVASAQFVLYSPSSIQAGSSDPTTLGIACNSGVATTTTAYLFDDTAITTGNAVYKCAWDASNSTFHWFAPFAAPVIATATTGTITAGSFVLGGCTSVTTVTISGATVGTNAAAASPIFTTAPTGNIGLFTLNAWVSAANTVSVQGCALGVLSALPNFTAKVLMY